VLLAASTLQTLPGMLEQTHEGSTIAANEALTRLRSRVADLEHQLDEERQENIEKDV